MRRWRGGCRSRTGFRAYPGRLTRQLRDCHWIFKSDCSRTQYATDGRVTSCEPKLAKRDQAPSNRSALDQVVSEVIVSFFSELSEEPGHCVGVHTEQPGCSALVATGRAKWLPYGSAAQLAQVHEW